MYSIYKQNDKTQVYVNSYVADTVADVKNLPTDNSVYPGSTCFITATSEVYMLNASKQWVKLG